MITRTALAIAAAGIAIAAAAPAAAVTNLVVNGGFEAGYVKNTQFNTSYNTAFGPTGWTSLGSKAFNLYFDSATATTVNATTTAGTAKQRLYPTFTGASPDGGKFVALDGDSKVDGPLQQTINGLVVGDDYDVSFYWGASQLVSRKGATTEQLRVTFGGQTQSTPVIANASGGFTGWISQTFSFTATSTSQLLSFLSVGTPSGLPPLAVLDGISVTSDVPEPATWALMLTGFGLVGFAARRRRRTAGTVAA